MPERKTVPRGEWAESTRKKQIKWQKENRMKLAADVDRETGEQFRAYCADQKKSVSAVLAEYVRFCLSSSADSPGPKNPAGQDDGQIAGSIPEQQDAPQV